MDPLTGEHVALDLVNTRTADGDLLATADDLRVWLELEAGRVGDGGDWIPGDGDLAAVRSVREDTSALLRALRAGKRPPVAALDGLVEAQRRAPATTVPVWEGDVLSAVRVRAGGPGERLAAALAEAAVEFAGSAELARLRECEAGDCVLLFVPAHPRRRWCSPARCGNRVRVARHYHRHKDV
ncbi:CGNR zinc finger domain-containing protein [Phytomonospora endophytica]|uniref:Putative RNA-binding Zn ribbon-like protein n=1 Tax=Phytomonospora endophytica TaxID=714109 RepID=A0A841FMT0_9ACTN|nr:CGNR zinc finger domain-containing protein [Phytomonospora endophytica]MBB6034862.1 putative RNA-binding Zn ribbon-like protein [Phytomonospora endophytica]GIG70565.1 hypothetical protein Pen01_68600 [Phytomonospora endophytica]